MRCPACQTESAVRLFVAREMMFGWRHLFQYAECRACGSLHLVHVPADLGVYYPPNYGSLQPLAGGGERRPLRAWVGRWITASKNPLAAHVARALARKHPFLHWARIAGTSLDAAILDVGCGSGGLLRRMRRWGFSQLQGVDPYAPAEIDLPGLRIVRGGMERLGGPWDLIMFHHVLEHVPDPIATLRESRARLRPDGRVLVRIPLAGSRAARDYGPDWFNLDPPRHLVVPSRAGLRRMAEAAGLKVTTEEFDADETSFTFSEGYRRDIPMRDTAERVSPSDLRRYRRLARELNATGEADRGVFVLAPS